MAEYKATVGEAGEDARDSSGGGRDLGSRSAVRRDPRADPDDDPPSGRVDVVTMDRGGSSTSGSIDTVQNAALSFRREIAKLHQQASAFERAIEEQRRERSDAFERIDVATSRAGELERKLEAAETEIGDARRLEAAALADLGAVRTERDALKRAVETAKGTDDELSRARATTDTLRKERDEALAAAAQFEATVKDLRERENDGARKGEAELRSLREQLSKGAEESARLRKQAADATDSSAKTQAELGRELESARSEIDRLGKAIAESRLTDEKLVSVANALKVAKAEAAETRSELARLERDLETARHTRDVSIERATIAEHATEVARKEADRVQRELEGALIASAGATTRAIAAERAKAAVEESVRQIREEVTAAFGRWRVVAPSALPPAGSLPPPAHADALANRIPSVAPPNASVAQPNVASASVAPEEPEPEPEPEPEAGPETPRATTSFPPVFPEARPLSMRAPSMRPESIPPTPLLDEDWLMDSRPPSARVPPPLPAQQADSTPARPSGRPSHHVPAARPASTAPSAPPPEAAISAAPPTVSIPKISERPAEHSPNREAVFELLADVSRSREAALELRAHPEWLRGRPPLELLMALSHLDYDLEAPLFEVARLWENEPLSRALVAGLRDEPDPKLREHSAWLLKHLASSGAWSALAELVTNDSEPSAVRRWLLEAIERLVATQAIGWRDVGDVVQRVVRHSDASLRDGVVGIVAALERSDDKRRVLLEVLRTDDNETVLSSAVKALTTALPIVLDPAVAERLLGHPSPRVQQSVVDFIERSRKSAKS